jgi:hypothetical protein
MSQFENINKNDLSIIRQAIRTYRAYYSFDYTDSIGKFSTKRMDEIAEELDTLLVEHNAECKQLYAEKWKIP